MKKSAPVEVVSNDFPKMVYRHPATCTDPSTGITVSALQDGSYDTAVAEDAEQHETAKAEGWHDSAEEARAASSEPVKAKKAAKA